MYSFNSGVRWEDEEKSEYGIEALRNQFRQRLYGDIVPKKEDTMDMTPQDMIQHTIEMAAHKERMRLTKAQEMLQLAEAAARKSQATYRYSLLAYLHEEIERRATDGSYSYRVSTKDIPWTVAEIEKILPMLNEEGFKTNLEYDNSSMGLMGSISNINTTYKILDISWK
jgi:hypothetical protein